MTHQQKNWKPLWRKTLCYLSSPISHFRSMLDFRVKVYGSRKMERIHFIITIVTTIITTEVLRTTRQIFFQHHTTRCPQTTHLAKKWLQQPNKAFSFLVIHTNIIAPFIIDQNRKKELAKWMFWLRKPIRKIGTVNTRSMNSATNTAKNKSDKQILYYQLPLLDSSI